jgi:hypothetical protein
MVTIFEGTFSDKVTRMNTKSGPLANANGVDAQTAVIASVIFILLSIEVTSSFLLNGVKKADSTFCLHIPS